MTNSNSTSPLLSRPDEPRLPGPLRAVVRGAMVSGAMDDREQNPCKVRFEEEASARDVSATGLSLVMTNPVAPGARLFIVLSFDAVRRVLHGSAPHVAVLGVVRHVQVWDETHCCANVELTHHRFLDAEPRPRNETSPRDKMEAHDEIAPTPIKSAAPFYRCAMPDTIAKKLTLHRAALLQWAWGGATARR